MANKKFQIELKRDECIGCGSCICMFSELFEEDEEDGLATLKDNQKKRENNVEILGDEKNPIQKNYDQYIEASQTCPTECIKIIEFEDSKTQN